jgi:DNA-binding transcriptional regulator YhcF (GntR family)
LKEEYEEFRKRLNNYWKERSISCMNEILTQEKSIYLQIAEMIETDILRDILLEEERVPSTNELAKLYAINPATAAKGVNILVDEGVLYKKRGIGMFVSAGAKEAILSRRKNEFYDNYVKKLLEEAASIGLGKEEVIQLIKSGNEA